MTTVDTVYVNPALPLLIVYNRKMVFIHLRQTFTINILWSFLFSPVFLITYALNQLGLNQNCLE
jgi:hypothetical protein